MTGMQINCARVTNKENIAWYERQIIRMLYKIYTTYDNERTKLYPNYITTISITS